MKWFHSVAVMLGSAVSLAAVPAIAITHTGFAENGEGGVVNSQDLTVGSGGVVWELDHFVNTGDGGDEVRIRGDFSVAFESELADNDTDLILTFELTRLSGSSNVTWLTFLDAEIDEADNSFFNESARTGGTLAAGQNFEIDEPGYAFGDLLDNIFDAELDGTNAFDSIDPEDVAMAMSFELGAMNAGDTALIELMISEDGSVLGPFGMTQYDPDSQSTEITFSGQASRGGGGPQQAIPEPSAALVFALGALFTDGAVRKRSSPAGELAS